MQSHLLRAPEDCSNEEERKAEVETEERACDEEELRR